MKNRRIISNRERFKTIILYSVFIFYILLLLKMLFLSRISFLELFNSQRIINRSINYIPFNSITEFISGSSENAKRFAFANIAGNIVIFIPLGAYLSLFKKDKRIVFNILYILIASLLVEIIQGILGIGVSDIDDIILNCLGGCIGILGYKLLAFILRDKINVSTAITILSAIGLPFIIYYLFFIKMRF